MGERELGLYKLKEHVHGCINGKQKREKDQCCGMESECRDAYHIYQFLNDKKFDEAMEIAKEIKVDLLKDFIVQRFMYANNIDDEQKGKEMLEYVQQQPKLLEATGFQTKLIDGEYARMDTLKNSKVWYRQKNNPNITIKFSKDAQGDAGRWEFINAKPRKYQVPLGEGYSSNIPVKQYNSWETHKNPSEVPTGEWLKDTGINGISHYDYPPKGCKVQAIELDTGIKRQNAYITKHGNWKPIVRKV